MRSSARICAVSAIGRAPVTTTNLTPAGHGDSRWLTAVIEQAKVLTHTSNLFHTVPQVLFDALAA